MQPQEAVRVVDGIALLGPDLLLDELVEVSLLDVDEVLGSPQLREHDGVVDRLAALHERRGGEAQVRALARELGCLVR